MDGCPQCGPPYILAALLAFAYRSLLDIRAASFTTTCVCVCVCGRVIYVTYLQLSSRVKV